MNPVRHHAGWVIVVSFIVALMLTMMPLPEWARFVRPQWVTMVLIYWCMALPGRVSVGWGWALGLLLDVAHGSVLGQHALSLSLIAYAVTLLYQRLRLYPLSQQAIIVALLIFLQLLITLWVKGATGAAPDDLGFWLTALTSALLWPWSFMVLRDLRRKFKVS
ncbi:MAG TPA: rod shape-determining protein MreD [Gammaproteobacteria bacterium]